MKKIINLIISFTMFGHITMADCKWADIKKIDNGYLYTESCHGRVGVLIKDLEDREIEVVNLRKGLELKDLALQKADERIILWRNESYEQFERLQKQSELASRNQYLWLVLGIVVTGTAVWGVGQLR